jgi:acyl-CoA reductase-like NAD-dependent aldehyde dehydrogenase
MQYAAQNLIPVTPELGGKSPNIFFRDVMAVNDDFLDKAVEGLVLYAFNKGEVCTCPSRDRRRVRRRLLLPADRAQGAQQDAGVPEEIFGPVLAVTTFRDEAEAIEIANDTLYGLGAGVWTRDGSRAFRMGRAIKAGRVWTNCYHQYPAGAAFGGYKISGIGRETHKMMLEHYSQTKNLLVSYSTKPLEFF